MVELLFQDIYMYSLSILSREHLLQADKFSGFISPDSHHIMEEL